MKKNLLVFTVIIFILSACGIPATPVREPTKSMPPAPTNITLSTATLLPSETPQSVSPYGITNSLDKFLALPDGYILYGNISWTDSLIIPYGTIATLVSIKDANGKEIPFTYADAEVYPTQDEFRQYWAYKINETNFAAPLSLSFVVVTNLKVDGGSFTFDPGPNPQLGQKWDINQNVTVHNEIIHVLFAKQGGSDSIGAFNFTMRSSDPNIIGATITDFSHPPVGFGGGGGGIPQADVEFGAPYQYQEPLPQGPYTLTFTTVAILVSGDWNLTTPPTSTLAPTNAPRSTATLSPTGTLAPLSTFPAPYGDMTNPVFYPIDVRVNVKNDLVTAIFYVKDVPAELTFDKENEYMWKICIDTDNDKNTGASLGWLAGADYCLWAYYKSSGTSKTMPIEQGMQVSVSQLNGASEKKISDGIIEVDIKGDVIKLSGTIPGVTSSSQLYYEIVDAGADISSPLFDRIFIEK